MCTLLRTVWKFHLSTTSGGVQCEVSPRVWIWPFSWRRRCPSPRYRKGYTGPILWYWQISNDVWPTIIFTLRYRKGYTDPILWLISNDVWLTIIFTLKNHLEMTAITSTPPRCSFHYRYVWTRCTPFHRRARFLPAVLVIALHPHCLSWLESGEWLHTMP